MDRRLKSLAVWCLSGALAGLCPSALAQLSDIPNSIREQNQQLSAGDLDTIKKFVDENSKNLLSDDPQLVRKDREAILRKLDGAKVSVPFRIEFSKAVLPHVQEMLASKADKTVINGLVIAGELATDPSLALIQSKAKDPSPSVRYEAACSLGRVFRAVVSSAPAATQHLQAVKDLEALIATEKNPMVQDALVQAGLRATEIPQASSDATSAVSRGVSRLLKDLGNQAPSMAQLGPLLRTGAGLRDVMSTSVRRSTPLAASAAKDAAEVSVRLMMYAGLVVERKGLTLGESKERDQVKLLVAVAQTTIELSGQSLNGATTTPLNGTVSQNLAKGTKEGDAAFLEDVNGVKEFLRKPPFELTIK